MNRTPNRAKNIQNLRPFKPGQSGNPSGRPKGAIGVGERCRDVMDREGWDALVKLAKSAKFENVRVAAWKLIAAYGYGQPMQQVTGPSGGPIEVVIRYADR